MGGESSQIRTRGMLKGYVEGVGAVFSRRLRSYCLTGTSAFPWPRGTRVLCIFAVCSQARIIQARAPEACRSVLKNQNVPVLD